MTLEQRLARADTISECIAAIVAVMDKVEEPGPTADAMLAALLKMRDGAQGKVQDTKPVDYVERARDRARDDYRRPGAETGTGGTDTPLGRLTVTTRRISWDGKRGAREAWTSTYMLNGEPVTLAGLRKAGLAPRPHSRNRKRKAAEL